MYVFRVASRGFLLCCLGFICVSANDLVRLTNLFKVTALGAGTGGIWFLILRQSLILPEFLPWSCIACGKLGPGLSIKQFQAPHPGCVSSEASCSGVCTSQGPHVSLYKDVEHLPITSHCGCEQDNRTLRAPGPVFLEPFILLSTV